MWKIKLFFIKLVGKLFPHSRVLSFKTPDGMCYGVMGIDGGSLSFSLLKKPTHYSKLNLKALSWEDTQYKGNWIKLNFYTTESVDNLIKKLNQIKLNIELAEASKILQDGGTMVWEKEGEEIPIIQGATAQTYKISFQYPPHNAAEEKTSKK